MNGYIGEIFSGIELPPEVAEMVASYGFVLTLPIAVVCVIVAFWGYKIFKASLSIVGALVFGVLGATVVGPLVVGSMGDVLPGINISAAIGFVLAIVGAILIGVLYKVGIFVSGAAGGYLIGQMLLPLFASLLPDVEFITSELGTIIIPAVMALIVGIFSVFIFKFLYILATSVGGMTIVGFLVGTSVFNEPDGTVLIASLVVGAIVGIFAMVRQYKNADDL